MKYLDDAYEKWVLKNSSPEQVRQLAAKIVHDSIKVPAKEQSQKHMFINHNFLTSMIANLAETLKNWPDEVAAWRAILGMTEGFGVKA
jgi:hypothetical protein